MRVKYGWDLFFGLTLTYAAFDYSRKSGGIGLVRRILFYTSVALAGIILVGPLAHHALHNFTSHMIQHISLMMLISPLFVLGSPFTIWRLDRTFIRHLLRAEIGFAIFIFVLLATHFGPLANAGMRHPNIHYLELILFFMGGVIYYYPVMEGNPHPYFVPYSHRVISLFAMMLPETMTGFFLYSGNRLVHDLPTGVTITQGLHDQHTGGGIMWAMGMLIDTIWIVLAARDWFADEARRAEAEDE